MRATTSFYCANLRTLGLDGTRPHTAAEIKAAFVEKAKSTHPDAGGDPARFRQLKDAYDALRGRGGGAGGAAGPQPPYHDPYHDTAAAARRPQTGRPHIYAERYNDGDATTSSDKGTWDYGAGTRYANNSTRSFYRPYSSNYYDPSATGFTRAEVARAELAMRLHVLRRFVWNCLIYGSALYLLYEYAPRRERAPSTAYEVDLDEQEKARRERALRQMQPHLQAHWSDTAKARYLEEWNNRFRDREAALSNNPSVVYNEVAAGPPGSAVSDPVATTHFAGQQNTLSPLSSPKTYCDMADEDIEAN
ncbi:hypothetical protein ABB37_09550 [Leptomonas pyrrhocoris]|uniref:J domain-containing protein n=1 Tax=Leptomonas pyrrhocoris TaxID=157538 RepID=A0A0M9FQK1_LEPPY|nr:hypothetical protein ABB37_09550 [Leptomonas pyrrhocoris]KPA73973.1 hypothetical protein ABB37_09550 [Leptomonas pyrrhocoris]|eukprot:XP_015652412.1 hypothetical protein ABB37_09550 [Leptomonas pyrrhocoris]